MSQSRQLATLYEEMQQRKTPSPTNSTADDSGIVVTSGNDSSDDTSPEKPKSKGNIRHTKPSLSYIALISKVILESPNRKLLLCQIYSAIEDKFPYFKEAADKAWRNSIRHNLSLNECFIKDGRSDCGKGNYWSVHPACVEDFQNGDYRRRNARRRARRSTELPPSGHQIRRYTPMSSTEKQHPYLASVALTSQWNAAHAVTAMTPTLAMNPYDAPTYLPGTAPTLPTYPGGSPSPPSIPPPLIRVQGHLDSYPQLLPPQAPVTTPSHETLFTQYKALQDAMFGISMAAADYRTPYH